MTVKERMPHIITVVLFVIFITLGLASATTPSSISSSSTRSSNVNANWSVGIIKNEWGENTGKFYSQSRYITTGIFYTDLTDNGKQYTSKEEINIRLLTFSNSEGLTFIFLYKNGMHPLTESSMDVDIIIRQKNGEEKQFTGFYNYSNKSIEVEYSDKLRDALLSEDIEIRVSFTTSSSNAKYRFQFNFPSGFQEAYTKMIADENSFVLNEKSIKLHWNFGQFVDEWGVGLKEYFIRYGGSVPAWYIITNTRTNSNFSKEKIYIKDLSFSKAEGLSFPMDSVSASNFPSELKAKLIQENGNEKIFDARFSKSSEKIFVPYSDDLCNILLLGKIKLLFEGNYSNWGKYNIIFTFPEQFNLANERLKEKEIAN